jgi:hypothetical protein
MSIFHIINFKKKNRAHRDPGFFNKKTNPGFLFLLKVEKNKNWLRLKLKSALKIEQISVVL